MKNTWDEEVAEHEPDDCHECRGSGFYKTPYGCTDDCEDEDNCYCDCHEARVGDGDLVLKWYWRHHVLEVEEEPSVEAAVASLRYAEDEGLSSPSHIEVVSSGGATRRIEGAALDDMGEAQRREQEQSYRALGLTRPYVAKVVITDGAHKATLDHYQDLDKGEQEVARLTPWLGDRVHLEPLS